jgi:hypothetical protein
MAAGWRQTFRGWEAGMKMWGAIATVALVIAASAAACAQAKKEIKWGAPTVASPYYWDIFGAIELGYMDAEGLAITIINNDNPVQNLQFLATGALDISSISTELAISATDGAPRNQWFCGFSQQDTGRDPIAGIDRDHDPIAAGKARRQARGV